MWVISFFRVAFFCIFFLLGRVVTPPADLSSLIFQQNAQVLCAKEQMFQRVNVSVNGETLENRLFGVQESAAFQAINVLRRPIANKY